LRALDIGSGHNPVQKSGWREVGDVDHLEFTNMDGFHADADVKHSFEALPWPFEDDTFDFVFARHSLEHVRRDKLLEVMREISRVSKDGAFVHVRVPYWNSESFAGDPTHWNMFCETTFRHMCHGGLSQTDFYLPVLFRAAKMEFRFQPKFRFLPRRVLKELMHVLCGVCDEMWVTLEVNKHPMKFQGYRPRYVYGWNSPMPRLTTFLYAGLFWGGMAVVIASLFRLLFR